MAYIEEHEEGISSFWLVAGGMLFGFGLGLLATQDRTGRTLGRRIYDRLPSRERIYGTVGDVRDRVKQGYREAQENVG